MKKLLVITRLWLINSFSERGDMFLYGLSNCIAPLVIMFVWLTFTPPGKTSVLPHDTLIVYFLLTIIVKLICSSWAGQFLSSRIRTGRISPYLTQPAPYLIHYVTNNVAEKLIKLMFVLPIVIICGFLLKANLSSISIVSILIFFVSLGFAAAIDFLIDICIGLTAFWIDESYALLDLFSILYSLFSGAVIPLVALPSLLLTVSHILPFRYSTSLPIEILLGQVHDQSLFFGLALQVLWLVLIIFIYKLLWIKGLKVYSASGA